ncbi:MAG: hypothetical protein BGO37_11605 [Cellulomonas sp. 73-92]|uniref:class I adenylate-forming enzyme family protein n=1 Tax=Cellulomonas sp. 73-92 TaxID=1895740 RepID=UPI00092C70A4|nr:AMP-binding protein [Cellulomonas sp. 73-92]OJV76670.1 MAG: hypothetical protein BGO37_11605 [Cellulomonas sp. 73-92]
MMSPTDLSLVSALGRRAQDRPDDPVIRDDADAVLDAGTVWRLATALATTLREQGTRRGDRVCWSGRNDPGLLVTLLATHLAGAVFVPLNFRATGPELAAALDLVEPRAVVVHPATGPVDPDLAACAPARLDWPTAALRPADDEPAVSPDPDDLAVLMFTSGSTGRPRAVMLSHANLWWSSRNLEECLDLRADDVTLAVAPMFHIGGLNTFTLSTLRRGGTAVVRSTFCAERTLTDLAVGGITSVFGVPAMYAAIARCPEFGQTDLSHLRVALVGGAPVATQLVEAYARQGATLYPSWGMTEVAPSGTLQRQARGGSPTCSIGTPLPYLELQLVDTASGEVVTGAGRRGEIRVRGPQVTRGYWRDPQATAAALADGWLRTGDLAVRADDGCLDVVGRMSDVINTGGEKVLPDEVAAAIAGLDVADLVVVGAPDPTWGEIVVAVLECDPATAPSLEEVRALASPQLARYKLPKAVVALAALPRTASGKVDRCAVRTLAAYHLRPEQGDGSAAAVGPTD